MVIFLLLLILAILFLGTGGLAALFLFMGFCVAVVATWLFFGAYAAVALAVIGFFTWLK